MTTGEDTVCMVGAVRVWEVRNEDSHCRVPDQLGTLSTSKCDGDLLSVLHLCGRQDHQASCSWTSPRRVWTQKPDGRSGTSSVRRAAAAAATPVQVARARTHDHVCVWLTEAEKANGRCMIITTHSMEEADVLCGRIGILHLGKLQCVGTQLRLKNRYGALRRSCFRMWLPPPP